MFNRVPEKELGTWTLPPLLDSEPDINLDEARRERLEKFLAEGGIQKALMAADPEIDGVEKGGG